MKRLTLAAGIVLVASVPAMAKARPIAPRHALRYTRLYHQVAAKFGHRAPGRNIVRWGGLGHGVSDAQVVASIAVLERMLAPAVASAAAVEPVAQSVTQLSVASPTAGAGPTVAGTSPSTAGGSAAPAGSPLPACTWQPESGGNPSAVNPSSGAGGYYQITPGTWAAYGGTGAPQDAPIGEQTAIAQKIYQSQGASAWTNC